MITPQYQIGFEPVRNLIYERVFDLEWVRGNMPEAELRRQRAAFLKGVVRTASVATLILGLLLALALSAQRQARRANQNLYAADMNLALQAHGRCARIS